MLNPEVIKERLKEMDENLKILSELKGLPLEEFQSNVKTIKLAERCLEISIQCLIDICHYVIAANNWPRAKDNQGAISSLGQNGVIPLEFSQRILPMGGLRNILVHEYLKVDPQRIYEYLQRTGDFRKFQEHILSYLENLS